MLKTPFRGWKHYQVIRKKKTVDPVAFKSDTLVESAMKIYAIRIDYEENVGRTRGVVLTKKVW